MLRLSVKTGVLVCPAWCLCVCWMTAPQTKEEEKKKKRFCLLWTGSWPYTVTMETEQNQWQSSVGSLRSSSDAYKTPLSRRESHPEPLTRRDKPVRITEVEIRHGRGRFTSTWSLVRSQPNIQQTQKHQLWPGNCVQLFELDCGRNIKYPRSKSSPRNVNSVTIKSPTLRCSWRPEHGGVNNHNSSRMIIYSKTILWHQFLNYMRWAPSL